MLLEKVQKTIAEHRMLQPGDRVLVTVSGGPDSVALCHLLHRLRSSQRIELAAAHVHHGLRGAEADEDVRFVQDLCHRLGLPVVVHHIDVRAEQKQHGGSLQMVARTLRNRCLREAMAAGRSNKLALGHSADDQAEEILLRVFRGTGQRGLTGMPACDRNGIIRPLLECYRHEILDYLESHTLAFRQDTSNLTPWCQRNLLRLELLPQIHREFNSNLNATLLRTSKIFREEEEFWESMLDSWLKRYSLRSNSSSLQLPIEPLLEAHPALQRRLLRRLVEEERGDLAGFSFLHTELLLQLCRSSASNRQMHLPGGLVAKKSYSVLTIGPQQEPAPDFYYEIPGPGVHNLPLLHHVLEVQHYRPKGPPQFSRDPTEVIMDQDRISFPLFIRPSKAGDRFRPLGLGGSKKIKDFFIDVKAPRSQRRRTPILCSADHIIWIVGYRLDDRVRITANTSRMFRLRYKRVNGKW